MPVPMMCQDELNFYEKLTKLKILRIEAFIGETSDKAEVLIFPESFRQLKKLHLPIPKPSSVAKSNFYWALIEHCNGLEICNITHVYGEIEQYFKNLHEFLERNENIQFHLRFCDMSLPNLRNVWDSLDDTCNVSSKFDIKFQRIDLANLFSLENEVLKKISKQVLSVQDFYRMFGVYNFYQGVTLPNLKRAEVPVPKLTIDPESGMPDEGEVAEMGRIISADTFPSLRKLEINFQGRRAALEF